MDGKTVAILETRLGSQLAELVERRGARALHAPALAEVPDVDPAGLAAFIDSLAAMPPAVAIFQTGVGTQALFEATDALGATPKLVASLAAAKVVVRGPKPTAVLRRRGVRIDLAAAEPFTTAEVLAALDGIDLAGARVMVQRYGAANERLDEALRSRGAVVTEIPTYRWALPADTAPMVALMDALERGTVDAAVFTSAAQVHNLFDLGARQGRADALRGALNRTLVASIGPVCSEALRSHGVEVGLEARPPKLGPLVEALAARLAH